MSLLKIAVEELPPSQRSSLDIISKCKKKKVLKKERKRLSLEIKVKESFGCMCFSGGAGQACVEADPGAVWGGDVPGGWPLGPSADGPARLLRRR